jgi:ATP-dependent Clp protease ATP-binding subunit ClpC
MEAPRLHHDFIGTEHVLLGMLSLENGVLPGLLKRMGVDRQDIRSQIEKWFDILPAGKISGRLPYTPRVKKALSLAAREAKACHSPTVGPEHIFLGLLLEGDGIAGRVLKNLGLTAETTRAEILKVPPKR